MDVIIEKLNTLIRLQAYSAVSGFESQKDKILFLSKSGISPTEIASILGTTANTVNVALSTARKAAKKKKDKSTKAETD